MTAITIHTGLEKTMAPKGVIKRCHKALDSLKNINQNSVNEMSEKSKTLLRENTPARMKELAELNCFAAEKVKTTLDKKYGENNYVLIAVGRSVSSIVELAGKMGADTKNIPLSGLRFMPLERANIQKKNRTVYRNYLKKIGLSKDILKNNPNKQYILTDYTYSGRSLERTKEFLQSEDMLGKTSNLSALPIKDVLGEDYKTKKYDTLFNISRFKYYSQVGKLPITDLKNVNKQGNPKKAAEYQGNITKGIRKLFWFNVFDALSRNNYKTATPTKEMNALTRHYMTPKAITNKVSLSVKENNALLFDVLT